MTTHSAWQLVCVLLARETTLWGVPGLSGCFLSIYLCSVPSFFIRPVHRNRDPLQRALWAGGPPPRSRRHAPVGGGLCGAVAKHTQQGAWGERTRSDREFVERAQRTCAKYALITRAPHVQRLVRAHCCWKRGARDVGNSLQLPAMHIVPALP